MFSQPGATAQLNTTFTYHLSSRNMTEDSVGAAQVGASVMYANQGPPTAYREKEQTNEIS